MKTLETALTASAIMRTLAKCNPDSDTALNALSATMTMILMHDDGFSEAEANAAIALCHHQRTLQLRRRS
jgi:hypothetical protein